MNHIEKKKQNQEAVRPDENFAQKPALEIRSEVKGVDDDRDIEPNVQKMNHAPDPGGNIFPRVGCRDQNNHEVKSDCPQPHKNRLKAGMKRNENVLPAERNEFVKKQTHSVDKSKNERLKRDPAVKIEALESQKIFPDSGKAGNSSNEDGDIEKQKTDKRARPHDIPVPGNHDFFHKIFLIS